MRYVYSIVCVLLIMMVSTVSYCRETVKCSADISQKLTKDGFVRIILICESDVLINKSRPLKMYVDQGLVVFDQTDVDKSMLKPQMELVFKEQQPPEFIPAVINPRKHKIHK